MSTPPASETGSDGPTYVTEPLDSTEPFLSTEVVHTSLAAMSTPPPSPSHEPSPSLAAMSTEPATEEESLVTDVDGTEEETTQTTEIPTECHTITPGPTICVPVTPTVETICIPAPSTTTKSCCGGGMGQSGGMGECMEDGKECMSGKMTMGHGMMEMMQGGMMQGGMMQGGMMQGGMMGRAAAMGTNEFRVALSQNPAMPLLYPVILDYPYGIFAQ
eukprot:Protomagalhaensia_wolfi_Nauph_80__29@NODE_1018_length_1805_cov_137_501133_g769_i0_p1_GENE_NODE_1018_length_1805_cov_137_501133_g769_i0NODE_1018_length_1805_cov_137_501133_g769_i0_p1_ORF_typecomplete_len217_score43_15GET2/PF08690_10/0_078_NODE_1018_length_1805_cov_137_501133_g769_i0145795